MELRYEEPKNYSRREVIEILNRNEPDELYRMLVGITFNMCDYNYIVSVIVGLFEHESWEVIAGIFECFGHIARLYKKLPEEEVKNFYCKHKHVGDDSEIRCGISCFLDDIEVYIPEFHKELVSLK